MPFVNANVGYSGMVLNLAIGTERQAHREHGGAADVPNAHRRVVGADEAWPGDVQSL